MCDKTYGTHITAYDEEDLELKFNMWLKEVEQANKLYDECRALRITKLKIRPDIYAEMCANQNIIRTKNECDRLFGIKLEVDNELLEPYKFMYLDDEEEE